MNNTEIELAVKKIESKIQKLEQKRNDLNKEIDTVMKQYTFTCGVCKTESMIGESTFIEHYWYESPHGCTGGDNWWLSHDVANIECPNCKSELRANRSSHGALLDKKHHFKEIRGNK